MSVFKSRTDSPKRDKKYSYWNEEMYRAIFASDSVEVSKVERIGWEFHCDISHCRIEFDSDAGVRDEYFGYIQVMLNESEYCMIKVVLSFYDFSEWSPSSVTESDVGYMVFGWSSGLPSLDVSLRRQNGLQKKFQKMYKRSKQSSGDGISLSWISDISNILGKSAELVWGDWSKIDFGSEFAGRGPFVIRRFSLSADV